MSLKTHNLLGFITRVFWGACIYQSAYPNLLYRPYIEKSSKTLKSEAEIPIQNGSA